MASSFGTGGLVQCINHTINPFLIGFRVLAVLVCRRLYSTVVTLRSAWNAVGMVKKKRPAEAPVYSIIYSLIQALQSAQALSLAGLPAGY